MKTSFFKQLKKDIKNKNEHKKALFFLFLFIIFFSIFYFILSKTIIYNYINFFYGFVSNVILNIFGISTSFVFDKASTTSIIFVAKLTEPLIINFLCAGIIEFCLLASAILASKGISLKKRATGFFLSIPLVIFFNLFRIIVTSLFIIYSNLFWATLVHGFLFRIFLIIVVIGFYYFWFRWSNR